MGGMVGEGPVEISWNFQNQTLYRYGVKNRVEKARRRRRRESSVRCHKLSILNVITQCTFSLRIVSVSVNMKEVRIKYVLKKQLQRKAVIYTESSSLRDVDCSISFRYSVIRFPPSLVLTVSPILPLNVCSENINQQLVCQGTTRDRNHQFQNIHLLFGELCVFESSIISHRHYTYEVGNTFPPCPNVLIIYIHTYTHIYI